MNKTLCAVIALCFSAPSQAETLLFKDADRSISLGGYADIRLLNTDSTTEVVNGTSRISLNFAHKIDHNWQTAASMEWGVNPFGDVSLVYNKESQFTAQNDQVFNSRLAYVSLSHQIYGQLSFGKQWSVWYDVTGNTDNAYVWGGAASGVYTLDGSGGIDGTGRADRALQYRQQWGKLSLGLQTQLQQNSIDVSAFNSADSTLNYDDTFGASLSYQINDNLSVAIGGNHGEFSGYNGASKLPINANDEIYGIGVTWGNLSDGWYLAANYNMNKFHDTDANGHLIPEAYGIEAFVAYSFDSGLQTYAAYNNLDASDPYSFPVNNNGVINMSTVSQSQAQYLIFGSVYVWDPTLLTYVETQLDFSNYVVDGVKAERNNGVAIGIRYTF